MRVETRTGRRRESGIKVCARSSNFRWSLSRPSHRAAIPCLPFPASTTASCSFMHATDSDSEDDSDYVPPLDNGEHHPFPTLRIAHCAHHRTRGRLRRRRTRAETRSYRRRAGDNLYGGHSRHEVRPHSSLPPTASLTFPDQNRRRCVCRFQSVLERPPRAASAAGPRRPGDG